MPSRHTALLQVLSGALATCSLLVPVEACDSHASCSGDTYCDSNHNCYTCDYVRDHSCDAVDGDCSTCTTSGGSTAPTPACASTEAGCSAFSLITSGTCDTTPGCAAIIEEDGCRELRAQVDIQLCVAASPRARCAPHLPVRVLHCGVDH